MEELEAEYFLFELQIEDVQDEEGTQRSEKPADQQVSGISFFFNEYRDVLPKSIKKSC